MVVISKLCDFFKFPNHNGEVLFADQEGIRCRLGLCIRTIYDSDNGLVPQPEKNIFSVSKERLADIEVAYASSDTRRINPKLPGAPVMMDVIEDNGVFYYTIIFEKKERPRLLQKRNWN